MPERRADQLVKGDRVRLAGDVWTVTKAKTKGKTVRLGIEGRRGSFVEDVKAKARYSVVVEANARHVGERGSRAGDGRHTEERAGRLPTTPRQVGTGPLLDSRGAMTRWADDLTPPADLPPKKTTPWPLVAEADRVVIEELGAKLIGVEVEGGKLLVPPVSDATILGHLLTMHGRRFDGATVAEAKTWAREHDVGGTKTADEVLAALDLEKAHALHTALHKDLTAMPTPHWHRERAPR